MDLDRVPLHEAALQGDALPSRWTCRTRVTSLFRDPRVPRLSAARRALAGREILSPDRASRTCHRYDAGGSPPTRGSPWGGDGVSSHVRAWRSLRVCSREPRPPPGRSRRTRHRPAIGHVPCAERSSAGAVTSNAQPPTPRTQPRSLARSGIRPRQNGPSRRS
jgi:hypothetical protein